MYVLLTRPGKTQLLKQDNRFWGGGGTVSYPVIISEWSEALADFGQIPAHT